MSKVHKVVPQLAAAMMGKRYSYYISLKQFMEYTGFAESDIIAAAEIRGFHY